MRAKARLTLSARLRQSGLIGPAGPIFSSVPALRWPLGRDAAAAGLGPLVSSVFAIAGGLLLRTSM